MCLKSMNTCHLKPEVGVSWRSIFSCSSLHAMRGGVLGCWLGCACCVRALQAGAEQRIKARAGAGILKASAGRELLEAPCFVTV